MITFKNYLQIDENRAVVSNPRNIKAFIKQVEKKFPMYKGEIQQAEDDEIIFPNDPKLIKFFKGAREVKFVLKDSVELDEAMQFWTVTITKKAGKLFKGQTVDVKARNSAEAIKKGLKQMKANPNTVPSDSVDAVLGEELSEKPLTPQQRMQRSRIMKRLAPKMAMKRKMKAKKKADPNTLKARSEKKAREMIRAKIAKGDYDKMSYAQKIAIDKKVEAKRAVIKKIAKKLLPKVKKAEMDRIEKMRAATKQSA